jgi:CRP-like cAMP-binding protein
MGLSPPRASAVELTGESLAAGRLANEFIYRDSSCGWGRVQMPSPSDRAATTKLLGAVPIFSSLDKKHLQTLATAAAERNFNPGDVIVSEGQKGLGFYLIAEGQVTVDKAGKTVAMLGPGQFFGEMALLDEQPRTANVKAVARTRCLVLSPWEFWGSVGKDPEALRSLLRETVRRLRHSAPAPED